MRRKLFTCLQTDLPGGGLTTARSVTRLVIRDVLCSQTDLPGGGVTAGLTTARSVTRLVIRDVTGRYCWDNSLLYGPPDCRAGSFPPGVARVEHDLSAAEPLMSLTILFLFNGYFKAPSKHFVCIVDCLAEMYISLPSY